MREIDFFNEKIIKIEKRRRITKAGNRNSIVCRNSNIDAYSNKISQKKLRKVILEKKEKEKKEK